MSLTCSSLSICRCGSTLFMIFLLCALRSIRGNVLYILIKKSQRSFHKVEPGLTDKGMSLAFVANQLHFFASITQGLCQLDRPLRWRATQNLSIFRAVMNLDGNMDCI